MGSAEFHLSALPYQPARYLFARAFFKNVRPGITIGVIAGREQVEKYMSGAWWNNDPVIAARNIHISWGDIQNDG
ncbi:hypothetical protein BFD70_11640 [Escherichia coli]|nr:hypothetical protein BFD70_11640 [Escherichia coli]